MLDKAETGLRRAIASEQAKDQLHRVKAWEHRLAEDWKTRRTATYKWVRDDFHPRAAFMKLDDVCSEPRCHNGTVVVPQRSNHA